MFFKALANLQRAIMVSLLIKEARLTNIEDRTVNLPPTMHPFTLRAIINKANDSSAKLVFKLCGDNNSVYLDDVSMIQDIDCSSVDIYSLKNGDFSQGANGLTSWETFPSTIGDAASTITVVNGEAKIAITNPGATPY